MQSTLRDRLQHALGARYSLERELGSGGMATVYLAHDPKHQRQIALKLLRPELSASIGSERFLSEIHTTAKLSHPHILPLFDSGSVDGFLFYVMPVVEGESLRERLTRDNHLPVPEALRLAREIGEGLAYAHAHGVIHRDIKPENILLQSGHALVADFGIARAVSAAGSERLTHTGMSVGTPAYMSPEQAAGEPDVDCRSDLYSLASVLYEMLAGEPPFTGPTADSILVQRFTRPAPRVGAKRGGVSRSIEAAICTALARAPEERFDSVERFLEALGSTDARPADSLARSVAVLPFANMSGDAGYEYFSDGVTEEIINALTQLPGLRVAARTSAFSFKGKDIDLRTVGEQLDVATVLEGSVRRAGGRLRITAQLISVADGYHLWSERYDRELTDVFAIQDEIATAIAAKLQLTLGVGRDRLVRPPTANLEAYDLYLKGRALRLQRGPALRDAIRFYQQTIARDPAFALAQAELSQALTLGGLYGLIPPAEVRAGAAEASARALGLDPGLAAAQVAVGLFALMIEFDRPTSSQALDRAVTLDPSVELRSVRAIFDWTYVRGAFDQAEHELREVAALDPLNVHARSQLSLALMWGGHAEAAVTEACSGIALEPQAFYPHWARVHALCLGPHPLEGMAAGSEMLARFGRHPWIMMALALAARSANRGEVADALYNEIVARARTEYVQPTIQAGIAHGAGKRTAMFGHLREAVAIRDPLFAVTALHWPGFAPGRNDPEYRAILQQIGWDQ